MKTFKSYITEDEEQTPAYIDEILRNYYEFTSNYTLQNNKVVTKAAIKIKDIHDKQLKIEILSCKTFTVKDLDIISMYGFPIKCDELNINSCDKLKTFDFDNRDTKKIQIAKCDAIKKIKNINSINLIFLYIDSLKNLTNIDVQQCSSNAYVTVYNNKSLHLRDISIGNKIGTFSFISDWLHDFEECNINATAGQFECKNLKTFNGLDKLEINKLILTDVNAQVKNLSELITCSSVINDISFDYDSGFLNMKQKTMKLRDIIYKYVFMTSKQDHIMDFTVDLIDAGFEDQV